MIQQFHARVFTHEKWKHVHHSWQLYSQQPQTGKTQIVNKSWIDKLWNKGPVEYYSVIEMSKLLLYSALQMNLKNTVFSERSQTQKNTYWGDSIFFFFFLAVPVVCGSSWARDQTHTTTLTPGHCSNNAGSLTCCTTRELPEWFHFYEILFFFFVFVFVFFLFRAVPGAYGGSQARGWNGATAAGLHYSHSNTGSEPHLRPTPQIEAMPDP